MRQIIRSIALLTLLALPASASAATLEELQAQLQALLARIAQIQSTPAAAAPSAPATISCPSLQRNVALQTRGADVTSLQHFLVARGHLQSDATTGYFGPLTSAAVRAFQCATLNICSGSAQTNGYGVVGPRTRAAIASQCATSMQSPSDVTPGTPSGPSSPSSPDTPSSQPYPEGPTSNATPPNSKPAPNTPYITPPQCQNPNPATETRTVACPAGQLGKIEQRRSTVCLASYSSPTWSEWTDVSSTCTTPNFTQEKVKALVLPPVGQNYSQYAPYVTTRRGWTGHLMYYCKNTDVGGIWRDRIWRIDSLDKGPVTWVNDMMVIEGTDINAQDDLSCAPAMIPHNGTWHLYYVTANRATPLDLDLYHAISSAPGLSWQKMGPISGIPASYFDHLDSPSLLSSNNKIVMYFVGAGHKLYRSESSDGTTFSVPVVTNAPLASHGNITQHGDTYYYVYSYHPTDIFQPPTSIGMATSKDGITFTPGTFLFSGDPGEWDSLHIWTPQMVWTETEAFIYYAGNSTSSPWWGSDAAIGYRKY